MLISPKKMWVLFTLFAILLTLILWIVFVPLYLRINTDLKQYEVSQAGTMTISFHPWQTPFMKMRILGFRVDTGKKKQASPQVSPKKDGEWGIKRSPSAWRYLAHGILQSFRLRRLECNVDLDDVVLNAKAVPVLMLFNRGVVTVSTNFQDRCFLFLVMEARFSKLLWTLIRFYTKK